MLTSLRYRLLTHYSVSWKMAFPDHLKDIGLPFDDAYALAVQMRGREGPGASG